MNANEALSAVKDMIAKDAALQPALTAAWNRVCDAIEARALKARPKPKNFEVRHECEHARATLLSSVASGKTLPAAETDALASVGLA